MSLLSVCLTELRRRGIRVVAQGDDLLLMPADAIPPELGERFWGSLKLNRKNRRAAYGLQLSKIFLHLTVTGKPSLYFL